MAGPTTGRSCRLAVVRSRLVALLLSTAPALALATDPCAADAQRLCSRARGDTAVLGCLRGQLTAVAPACRDQLDELLGIAQEYGQDCEADARRLCGETTPGQGRVLACLRDNQSRVSQSCQEAINRVRVVRMKLQAGCAGDVGRFCPEVPEGGGRILACLRSHQTDLSDTCQDVLSSLPSPGATP
jgi:hypothetical protein